MKHYLSEKKVSYNLMSLTGFKSLLLFKTLLESPKSYEEIKEVFKNHELIQETISIDTLRVYLNSLERMGCEISKSKRSEGSKYRLLAHPLELKIPDEQVTNLIKVYKAMAKSITVDDLLSLHNFFTKISPSILNTELGEKLLNSSPLKGVNLNILKALINSVKKNDELSILYNSPTSGKKTVDILTEKLALSNNKLYLYGKSSNYKAQACFLVSKIVEILSIKLHKTIASSEEVMTVKVELLNENIQLLENEHLIEEKDGKRIIEITTYNKFFTRQRILALGNDCKVLYPQSFKEDLVTLLKKMKEEYLIEEI